MPEDKAPASAADATALPGGYAYDADRTRIALRDAPWEARPPAVEAVPLAEFKVATGDSALELLSVRGAAVGVPDLGAAVRASPGLKGAFDRAVAGAVDLLVFSYEEAASPTRSPQQISASVSAYQEAAREPFAQALRDTVLYPGDAVLEGRADFVMSGLTIASQAAVRPERPGSVTATIELGYGAASWPARRVDGGPDADVVLLGAFPQGGRGLLGPVVLDGGDGADWLVGSASSDTLRGRAGVDVLHGGGGGDLIEGGAGDDLLRGDAGSDSINGGAGNDTIDGGADSATLVFGSARRLSTVGPGTVRGPEGSDSFSNVLAITFTDGTAALEPRFAPGQVWRLYDAALDRAPDAAGLAYWSGALANRRADLAAVAADFVGSREFEAEHGTASDEAFARLLYRNALGREPDAAELETWTFALGAGARRADVLVGVSESEEAVGHSRGPIEAGALWFVDNSAAQVARLYDAVLDRPPDDAGLSHWTGVSKRAGTQLGPGAVAEQLLASSEFQNRAGDLDNRGFVELLYRDALDRPPDEAGATFWAARLGTGAMRRADVAVAFSEAREHVAAMAPLIDDGIVVA